MRFNNSDNDGEQKGVSKNWSVAYGLTNIVRFSRCSITPGQYGFVEVGVGLVAFAVIIPRFITIHSLKAKQYLTKIKNISTNISRSGEVFTVVRGQQDNLLSLLSVAEKEYEIWKNELATPVKRTLKQQKKSPVPA